MYSCHFKTRSGAVIIKSCRKCCQKLCRYCFLGVGLHPGYGAAQRLYIKQGYVPDGSGVWFQNKQLKPNDRVLMMMR